MSTAIQSTNLHPVTNLEHLDSISYTKTQSNISVMTNALEQLSRPGRYGDWINDIANTLVPSSEKMTLKLTEKGKNNYSIQTDDNYTVRFSGKSEEWVITAPDGTATRIWGDPHVKESDGTRWDFTKQSTFNFGNNRITVETIPAEHNKSVTYSQRVSIYNGTNRITVTDIDKNSPKIEGWSFDAKVHDAALANGDTYTLKNLSDKSFSWVKKR